MRATQKNFLQQLTKLSMLPRRVAATGYALFNQGAKPPVLRSRGFFPTLPRVRVPPRFARTPTAQMSHELTRLFEAISSSSPQKSDPLRALYRAARSARTFAWDVPTYYRMPP